MNFITIADENWIQENFPDLSWERSFEKNDIEPTLAIFWRLLSDEGKRVICAIKFTEWQGTKEVALDLDDPVERLKRVISGADEVFAVVTAILQSKQQSLPPPVEKKKQ